MNSFLILLILGLLNAFVSSEATNFTIQSLITSNEDLATLNVLISTNPEVFRTISGRIITFLAPTETAFTNLKTSSPDVYNVIISQTNASSSLLKYHMIKNFTFYKQILPERSFFTTISGDKIRVDNKTNSQEVSVGTGFQMAPILFSIDSWNGQLAMIDSVLIPPPHLSQKLVSIYSNWPGELNFTDYFTVLDGLASVTVFLPTPKAFNRTIEYFQSNNIRLSLGLWTTVWNLHILPGLVYSPDLISVKISQTLTTSLLNSNILFERKDLSSNATVKASGNIKESKIIDADNLLTQGISHSIDSVLLPSMDLLLAASALDTPIYPFIPK